MEAIQPSSTCAGIVRQLKSEVDQVKSLRLQQIPQANSCTKIDCGTRRSNCPFSPLCKFLLTFSRPCETYRILRNPSKEDFNRIVCLSLIVILNNSCESTQDSRKLCCFACVFGQSTVDCISCVYARCSEFCFLKTWNWINDDGE